MTDPIEQLIDALDELEGEDGATVQALGHRLRWNERRVQRHLLRARGMGLVSSERGRSDGVAGRPPFRWRLA